MSFGDYNPFDSRNIENGSMKIHKNQMRKTEKSLEISVFLAL